MFHRTHRLNAKMPESSFAFASLSAQMMQPNVADSNRDFSLNESLPPYKILSRRANDYFTQSEIGSAVLRKTEEGIQQNNRHSVDDETDTFCQEVEERWRQNRKWLGVIFMTWFLVALGLLLNAIYIV